MDRRRRVAEHLLEDRQVHLRAASNNHDCLKIIIIKIIIIILSNHYNRRRRVAEHLLEDRQVRLQTPPRDHAAVITQRYNGTGIAITQPTRSASPRGSPGSPARDKGAHHAAAGLCAPRKSHHTALDYAANGICGLGGPARAGRLHGHRQTNSQI